MSLWLLASATLAVIAAALTGRVWLMWLATFYAAGILGVFFLSVA